MQVEYKDSPFSNEPDEIDEFSTINHELLNPSSPSFLHDLFNESVQRAESLLSFKEGEDPQVDISNQETVYEVLSNIYRCISESKEIEGKDFYETPFFTFIHLLLLNFSELENNLRTTLIEIVNLVFVHIFWNEANILIRPLFEIVMHSEGPLLERCINIVANCMAECSKENAGLHDLQLEIHANFSEYLFNMIDTCSDTVLLCNIFRYFANTLFQSWVNLELMAELQENMLLSLTKKVIAFLLPFDIDIEPLALNLLIELCRFRSLLPFLTENHIVEILCQILIEHQGAHYHINSESGSEDEVTSDESTANNAITAINFITQCEIEEEKPVSFLQNESAQAIIEFELVKGYRSTRLLMYEYIYKISSFNWQFLHEQGIINTMMENIGNSDFSDKMFNLETLIRFMGFAPKEIAKEYLNEDTIGLMEEMIDSQFHDSTEDLCCVLLAFAEPDVLEKLSEMGIPDKLVDFIDESENSENASKLLSLFEEED